MKIEFLKITIFLSSLLIALPAVADDTTLKAIVAAQQVAIAKLKKDLDDAIQRFARLTSVQNVRTIVTKDAANSYCGRKFPGSSAAHVPNAFLGSNGDSICRANNRNLKTCMGTVLIYIKNNNDQGHHPSADKDCQTQLDALWPWGEQYSAPNTLDTEWGHGNTNIICCK